MAIAIPTPLSSDSDKVVSLLQNAALFSRIGDTVEALHWLRQAVECAGDSGDDARTLALARSAADLNLVIEPTADAGSDGRSGVHERHLPLPPARSRPPQLADPDTTSTLTPPPLPSGRANGSLPPPASMRSQLTPARPAAPSMRSRIHAPPASRASDVPTPVAAAVARPFVAPAASTRLQKPGRRIAAPPAVVPSLRQAARVSVEKSSSEPGLFLVRLLEEGKAADSGRTEALLVSIDPNARPFAV